jgi:hypothetical protein
LSIESARIASALKDARRRLGRHVARADSCAARGQNEPRLVRQLLDRLGDRVPLIGHDASNDLETFGDEQLLEQVAARVLASPHVDAVGDCQDRSLHTDSFVFSTNRTSASSMPSSTAFAMS